MGSKTIDLEIALLHKTIKTPQQYFHTESLLAAMAKPLPAPRSRDRGGAGCGPEALILQAEKGRRQADLGRAELLQRSPTPGALPWGPSRREAGAHTRGAAARRARGSGSPRRTQLEPPAPVRLQGVGRGTAGRARGRDTKAEKRRGAGGGRCVPSGAASHYRSRRTGSGPSARAPRRRDSMSRSAERRGMSPERGGLPAPRGSQPAEQAGGARSQPRAPDARGPLCAGRALGPALRAAPRSGRRRCPCRGESARPARCQSAINAGPRPAPRSPLVLRTPRLLVGLLARRSPAPGRHWAPPGGAPADR